MKAMLDRDNRLIIMRDKILDIFKQVFGDKKDVMIVRAPGRVNLLGEHTDYNEGFVLPVAIDRDILIASRKRHDSKVIFYSCHFKEKVEFSLDDLKYNPSHPWINYPQGVAHFLQKEGYTLRGLEGVIKGDIPQGTGLASSAALEVASAYTFQSQNQLNLDPLKLIKLSQRAENQFVGVNCGIMDQFISVMGKKGHCLFLDCSSFEYQQLPLNTESFKIIICNTGIRRDLANSEYNKRRRECEEAVRNLQPYLKVKSLGQVSPSEFEKLKSKLPFPLRQRAEHVIYENQRVLKAVEFLKKKDLASFGRLMDQSHQSLRDLYQVSCPELDLMVEVAHDTEGVLGARMTGAGFGGSTVNLVSERALKRFRERVKNIYFAQWAIRPEVYSCQAVDGVEVVN